MNIPKVKFEVMSLEDNIDIIKWTFNSNDSDLNMHDNTIELFPELNKNNITDNELVEIVTNKYNEKLNDIKYEVERYNKLWNEYNDKYIQMLSNYLGVSFPDNIKEIKAYVGYIPIFPRDINKYTFSITSYLNEEKVLEVTAHETLHFLWFIKWNKLFPNTPRSHYETPYIEWKYSEMVTDPILNNKPFTDLFNFVEKGYDSFYELYDNNELVMDKLRNIYSSNDNIDDKIIKGFNYINRE